MKVQTAATAQPEPKIRKERNDKGKSRKGYKTRLLKASGDILERARRSYTFKNRVPKGSEDQTQSKVNRSLTKLSRIERTVLQVAVENQNVINAMGNGAVPFLVGCLVTKYGFNFLNEAGEIRSRLIKRALNHLNELNFMKVNLTQGAVYGPGSLQLV